MTDMEWSPCRHRNYNDAAGIVFQNTNCNVSSYLTKSDRMFPEKLMLDIIKSFEKL